MEDLRLLAEEGNTQSGVFMLNRWTYDDVQVEPIRNFFAALFLASNGMLIHVQFLWNHIDILLAAVILVVVIKTFVVAIVVKGFRYNNKTALLVGMSLAQIGEFAFVLLSRASNLHLIEGKLYLLLLGITALSLVTTPFVHLGVLLRWFTPDIPTEVMSFSGPSIGTGGRATRRAFEFGRVYVVKLKGKHQATIVWLLGLQWNTFLNEATLLADAKHSFFHY